MHTNNEIVRVEIVLDIACAWSYLAYARFQRALARHRATGGEVEVVFRPFQLVPDAPPDGRPLADVHREVFGPDAKRKTDEMAERAAASGVEMDFDRAVFANTFDAHRLIADAAGQGRAEAMVERLFRAYFTDGLNVADAGVLDRLAAEVGVARTSGNAGLVRDGIDRVRRSGIRGVPVLTVGDGRSLSGARSESDYDSALTGRTS